jgi:hypothetical protein
MKFVADVDLANSLLHESRREICINEAFRTDGQTKPGSVKTNAHLWHIYSHTPTHKLITAHLRCTVRQRLSIYILLKLTRCTRLSL